MKKAVVAGFLRKFMKIAMERGIDIIPRRKNMEDLAKLGLTRRNCFQEILSLSPTDYIGGPKPDKDKPGQVWEFGKTITGMEIYIKLKIAGRGQFQIAKCLSFHLAEHVLCFPLKRTRKEVSGNEENLPKLRKRKRSRSH